MVRGDLGDRGVDQPARDREPARQARQIVERKPLRVRDLSGFAGDLPAFVVGVKAIISEWGKGQLWLPK